jgi:hypothetical protein
MCNQGKIFFFMLRILVSWQVISPCP